MIREVNAHLGGQSDREQLLFLASGYLIQHQVFMSCFKSLARWVLELLPGVVLRRERDHRHSAQLTACRTDFRAKVFQFCIASDPSQNDFSIRMKVKLVASHQFGIVRSSLSSGDRHSLAFQCRFNVIVTPILIQQSHDAC